MDIKKARHILLQNPSFRREYNKRDLRFEIAKMVIDARIIKKITQVKLAKLMKTTQSSIARVENGGVLPSLVFLEKMASALNTKLIPPMFEFMDTSVNVYSVAQQAGEEKTLIRSLRINNKYLFNDYYWHASFN